MPNNHATHPGGSSTRTLLMTAITAALVLALSSCNNDPTTDPTTTKGSAVTNTDNGSLTAAQADQQIKQYKREIIELVAPNVNIEIMKPAEVEPILCQDNDTRPHAPTQYDYWYEAHGTHNDPELLSAAHKIVKHFTKMGWETYGKTDKPSPGWDMRSPDNYLLSLTISPDGNRLGVELSTPCVPRVETTFAP